MTPFRSIIEMIDTLHTEDECREYLETLLWGDAPVCPHCGTMDKEHWKLTFEFQSLWSHGISYTRCHRDIEQATRQCSYLDTQNGRVSSKQPRTLTLTYRRNAKPPTGALSLVEIVGLSKRVFEFKPN